MQERFHENLRARMKALNVGVSYLSLMTGLGHYFVQELVNGKRRPMLTTVRKLAVALDMKATDLWPK